MAIRNATQSEKKKECPTPIGKQSVGRGYQEKKHRIQRKWNRIRNGLDQSEKSWNHTQSKAKSRIKKENEPDAKRVDIKTQNSPVS
jgi:hypothetical protein